MAEKDYSNYVLLMFAQNIQSGFISLVFLLGAPLDFVFR